MSRSTYELPRRTVSSPIRTYRGDRWLDIRDEIARGLLPLHLEAIAGLARRHGWAGGSFRQSDEQAVQSVLAAKPPLGWPVRMSLIRYRLQAMDRTRSMGGSEHWMVDPNRLDLGLGVFEKLVRDRLARLPQPHDGSIVLHAEAAVSQQFLAQIRMSVAVGIPRPRPLSPREQIRMAKIRAQEVYEKDQTMIAMMGRQPDVVHAVTAAIEVSKTIDYPKPTAPPSPEQQARAEDLKGAVRAATKAVMDRVAAPGPPSHPHSGEPAEPPVETGLVDPWNLDD